jgi:hypothetical protein
VPSTTEFPVDPDAGFTFEDPEQGVGRLSVFVAPHGDGPRTTMVVELADWSVGFTLTSGQLHRLTNGLAGRGRRNTVRPLSVDEEHVYLTGTPTTLTVQSGDRVVEIAAGPKRGLSRALRALEEQPLLS